MKKLPVPILVLNALAFLGFGLAFLLNPSGMTEGLDIALPTARADIEIRAFYGGLELGFAAFLGLSALKRDWRRPALVCVALVLAATGGTRIAGMAIASEFVGTHAWLAALELSGAALSALAAIGVSLVGKGEDGAV